MITNKLHPVLQSKNWKRVNTSGVLCERKMNVNIKGKVYRAVVRPALVYGVETLALKKTQKKEIGGGRRNAKWMQGVTSGALNRLSGDIEKRDCHWRKCTTES